MKELSHVKKLLLQQECSLVNYLENKVQFKCLNLDLMFRNDQHGTKHAVFLRYKI